MLINNQKKLEAVLLIIALLIMENNIEKFEILFFE